MLLSMLGCWVSSPPVDESPIPSPPVVNSCEIPPEGQCLIGDSIIVKKLEQHHKHLVGGGTHARVTLSMMHNGVERQFSVSDSPLEEQRDALFVRFELKDQSNVRISWGLATSNVNEEWLRQQVTLPKECGAVNGISHFEQEGTWKIISENECTELWGGYSGMRIQKDHRYSGTCMISDSGESNCPFTGEWAILSGMAGEPPSSFVQVQGNLKWSESEARFEFDLGDTTEVLLEGRVVQLSMVDGSKETLHVAYQKKLRTFRENELKRRLSFPEYCGEITSSEPHPDFILFQTRKGCFSALSKHTGKVLRSVIYISE
jgi:hypothetical protein